jgi:aminoglycoside phosphotransferase (APT) family kinase protein
MGDRDCFAAVARRVVRDGRLRRFRALQGGVSANMHALEMATPGGRILHVVVRRHREAAWKPLEEDVTATEFRLLESLRGAGLAVPEPLLLDESCELLPSPYLVMELVEGTTRVEQAELPGALRRMAEWLARLHALEIECLALPELPEREDPSESVFEYLPSSSLGRRLRTALADGAVCGTANPPALLHGDFWPENILWRHGRIAAVVDWEDAALGDPVSDLACSRVELLCRYDEAAVEAFTAHYCSLTNIDLASLPMWELYVSSAAAATMADWGLAPEVEAVRRAKTLRFMERAGRDLLSRLEGRG